MWTEILSRLQIVSRWSVQWPLYLVALLIPVCMVVFAEYRLRQRT